MTDPFTYKGSRFHLLGEDYDPDLAEQLSNEKRVTADTPPAFLFHTGDDAAVPVENSTAYYLALREAGVPAELHIYLSGPHGVGLAPDDRVQGVRCFLPGLIASRTGCGSRGYWESESSSKSAPGVSKLQRASGFSASRIASMVSLLGILGNSTEKGRP